MPRTLAYVTPARNLASDNDEKILLEETPTNHGLFVSSVLPASSLRGKRPQTVGRLGGRAEESVTSSLARPVTSSAASLRAQRATGGLLWGPRDVDGRGTGSTPEVTSLMSSHNDDDFAGVRLRRFCFSPEPSGTYAFFCVLNA